MQMGLGLGLAFSLFSLLVSIFFVTLFILAVLELKAISRSLSNIEQFLYQQADSKDRGESRDINSKLT